MDENNEDESMEDISKPIKAVKVCEIVVEFNFVNFAF